ncbi:hypothetical protein M9Y10_006506 [Tritrichomonas musculus]|uniref:Viral A-type inclusion protein n=1 Tax=Tritrichomonas musculus TaxID=1915356 RepID=A0ABR2JFT7_9EUKA
MDYLKLDIGQGEDESGPNRWQYCGQIQGIDDLNSMKLPKIDYQNLKLSQAQVDKVKYLNQQIVSLGDMVEPPRNEADEQIKHINKEINNLFMQINEYTNQIQEQYDKRNEYVNTNNPDVVNYEEVQGHLFELLSKRNLLKQEIQINEKLLHSLQSKSKKSAQNNSSQSQPADVEATLQSLYDSLTQVNDDIAQYSEKRESVKDQKESLKTETKQFSNQIKMLKDKIADLKEKVQQKKAEKDQIIIDYNQRFDDFKNKINQKCKLECELNKILLEAESQNSNG